MGKCVLDYLPREEILAQLAEEASCGGGFRACPSGIEAASCAGWYESDTEERCRVRGKSFGRMGGRRFVPSLRVEIRLFLQC